LGAVPAHLDLAAGQLVAAAEDVAAVVAAKLDVVAVQDAVARRDEAVYSLCLG